MGSEREQTVGRRARAALIGIVAAVALALPSTAAAFDPVQEALNYSKNEERLLRDVLTPQFLPLIVEQNAKGPLELADILLSDPERLPGNVCVIRGNECAGEVRLYGWDEPDDYGIKTPVVFTARSGAVISGTVWATEAGPAQRPGVVITTGSVQAPETLYWGLAATLAKAGYVVLTYDVQGQGQSDLLGEAPDAFAGVPAQTTGLPFYDGTEDALDFLLSTPVGPFHPRTSCGTVNGGVGTDHSPKHDRRVAAGLATAFNPAHSLVDPSRVGIAGHSYGAAGVSFVGQKDPRVDALVAWDNLSVPGAGINGTPACPAHPESRTPPPVTKPALGMSADYGIVPTPFLSDPDPEEKNAAFAAYKAAGIDSMEVTIRGGSHEEFAFIPGLTIPIPLGQASLRGHHMTAFYTTAWLDKYVKCQGGACTPAERADADARLLSDRWRNDPGTAAIDPNSPPDPNVFSFYFRSRYDVGLAGGGDAICDDMRTGCASMGADGGPGTYSYLDFARTPDTGPGPGPEPDTDGDGLPDSSDSCPSIPGPGVGGDGCPRPPDPLQTACTEAAPQRGTARADTLTGTEGADRLAGLRGRDRLLGLGGDDCLTGQRGDDRLEGGPGADQLSGSAGRDRMIGGAGPDAIRAGLRNDRIDSRDGERDVINCGPGRDRVRADSLDVARRCERIARG